jgi:hypothetical protein
MGWRIARWTANTRRPKDAAALLDIASMNEARATPLHQAYAIIDCSANYSSLSDPAVDGSVYANGIANADGARGFH